MRIELGVEDDADVSKHVGVLTIHKILLIYMYIYVVHFFGLENKLYKMHGTYIRIKKGIIRNANLL